MHTKEHHHLQTADEKPPSRWAKQTKPFTNPLSLPLIQIQLKHTLEDT